MSNWLHYWHVIMLISLASLHHVKRRHVWLKSTQRVWNSTLKKQPDSSSSSASSFYWLTVLLATAQHFDWHNKPLCCSHFKDPPTRSDRIGEVCTFQSWGPLWNSHKTPGARLLRKSKWRDSIPCERKKKKKLKGRPTKMCFFSEKEQGNPAQSTLRNTDDSAL